MPYQARGVRRIGSQSAGLANIISISGGSLNCRTLPIRGFSEYNPLSYNSSIRARHRVDSFLKVSLNAQKDPGVTHYGYSAPPRTPPRSRRERRMRPFLPFFQRVISARVREPVGRRRRREPDHPGGTFARHPRVPRHDGEQQGSDAEGDEDEEGRRASRAARTAPALPRDCHKCNDATHHRAHLSEGGVILSDASFTHSIGHVSGDQTRRTPRIFYLFNRI